MPEEEKKGYSMEAFAVGLKLELAKAGAPPMITDPLVDGFVDFMLRGNDLLEAMIQRQESEILANYTRVGLSLIESEKYEITGAKLLAMANAMAESVIPPPADDDEDEGGPTV